MKKHILFLLILALGIGLRLWWQSYTHYTAEDAFITFQFARSIATHNEFSYNPGQPLYGTTTPLLAILLSTWYEFNTDLVLGSKVIALLAFAGGLTFLYLSLKGPAQWVVPFLLAISFRLMAEDMSGMEMSLLFFFMMGSIRGLTIKESWLSGLMCGFLLWTRIDAIVFVAVMAIAHYLDNKPILPYLAGTLVYVPWLLFAWWYFGSPIPFTITAKAVAYGIVPALYGTYISRLVVYLSLPLLLATGVSMFLITRRTFFLTLFILAQTAFLVFTNSTFFTRYFYLLTVACLIVIGLAISQFRTIHAAILLTLSILVLFSNTSNVELYRQIQAGRHTVLAQMGAWLHANTPPESTIQLEPLGYVGYGAQRVMIDEVGLVTPIVVDLHRNHIGGQNFFHYLHTDYILFQCHQADGVMQDLRMEYEAIQMFTDLSVRGCYELWRRK